MQRVAYREVVREHDRNADGPALIANLGVHGEWQPQGEGLFDVYIIDTDGGEP